MGDKSVPDPSFTPERVYSLGAAPAPSTSTPAPTPVQPPVADVAERVSALSVQDAPVQPAAPAAPAGDPSAPTAESTATPEGMDAMLDWCLLRGLVDKVPDSELPIKCEEFYSKVMLPCRPPGTTVDIKKSGYKKIAKMYSTWEKKGLLTVKAVHKIVRRARGALHAACAPSLTPPLSLGQHHCCEPHARGLRRCCRCRRRRVSG